jgi:hypothetical protein
MNDDLQHLQLLSIFHYVVGGITGLFACLPIIHFTMGILMVTGTFDSAMQAGGGPAPPAFFGWFFVAVSLVMIAAGWTMAVLILIAGRFLGRRTHHLYCLVMAGIECCFMPFGTILGVFTIVVLMRPSVKTLFEQGVPPDDLATPSGETG